MGKKTEITQFYKSVLDMDIAPIVLCDLEHTIVYMNKSAIDRYTKQGGENLIGKSLMNCHTPRARDIINRVIDWFASNIEHNIIYEFRNDEENKDVYMVALRDTDGKLIGYYEKHEFRNRETANLYDFGKEPKKNSD